jgi:L-amino acid N-acyltransferase YncA
MNDLVRNAVANDAWAICRIYNHFVLNTTGTFEEAAVSIDDMAGRIKEITAGLPWLVCVHDNEVLGYAYATKWRARPAYRHSVESSVYLAEGASGRGLGTMLYKALLDELAGQSIHAVMGGIVLPNPRSIALHEKLGFEKVAHFREVGFKFGQWLDVGYWQLIMKNSNGSYDLASLNSTKRNLSNTHG